MARPAEDAPGERLAEFMAGVIIPPTPRARPEAWVEGVLYRDPKGPPIVGELRVEHFPL
jgi:hypothetical protein